ncbi:MAG: SMP-30/gluconolactonase/LRE family protein [Deltaproteobacteria bacterium]|nr:SMP-30/gluconolactonase/LRE family protein [Deltaproteobacteria bacterium]
MTRRCSASLAAAVLLATLSPACGPPPKPPELPSLVWPTPPEVARYKLARVHIGEGDYEPPPSWFRRVFLGAKLPSEMVRLSFPLSVACHPAKDIVYVLDPKLRLILAFDEKAKKVRRYGLATRGRLIHGVGLAVDEEGTVYASDGMAAKVYAYKADGSLDKVFGQKGDFHRPTGLAVDRPRGVLYVADSLKHQVFVVDLQSGGLRATWGRRGSGPLEFNFPSFVAVDRKGNVLVADAMNFRIQVLSPDGKFVRSIGTAGNRPGNFFRLKGVAVDSENHYYAVDASFANFQVFQDDGTLLLIVGQGGVNPGEFKLPAGICVGAGDLVWVADQINGRIQGLQYLKNAGPAPAPGPASAPASQPGAR